VLISNVTVPVRTGDEIGLEIRERYRVYINNCLTMRKKMSRKSVIRISLALFSDFAKNMIQGFYVSVA
jgi:hypothetical protein